MKHLGDDIETRYSLHEGEFGCNTVIGFNFGDGHFHDGDFIDAIQQRCRVRAGRVSRGLGRVTADPQRTIQEYKVIDAALGVSSADPGGGRLDRHPALAAGRTDPGCGPTSGSGSPLAERADMEARTMRSPGWCHEHHDRGRGPTNGLEAARSAWPGTGLDVDVLEASDHIGDKGREAGGAHCARRASRPLLGVPSHGRRVAVPQPARPGAVRAALGGGPRSTAPTRSTRATPVCCGGRSTKPYTASAPTVTGGGGPSPGRPREFDDLADDLMRPIATCPNHPGVALARFGLGTLLPAWGDEPGAGARRRRGPCSAVSPPVPSCRSIARCRRRSGRPSSPPATVTDGRSPRAGPGRSPTRWLRC